MIPGETWFLPVRELGTLLRTGQLDPVELAEACLARVETFGPRLNAVVASTPERALREAARAREEIGRGHYRGPLHGIPYGVKDLIAAAGYPTTWGAEPFREQRFAEDATVVQRLSRAGAVLVAKLASVELAGGMGYAHADASFTGPTVNPWNLEFWSGGTSSGPGAAVAAGLVPFALGSETWGSIVTPAAFSGVVGLRPTYGRVSRHGAMPVSWTLDKIGPLGRTADDCGLVLDVIAGQDSRDPSASDRPFRYAEQGLERRFRIGVLRGVAAGSQPAVRDNFEAALDRLREVADIVPDVALPAFPYSAAAGVIIDAEIASIFEEFIDSGGVRELAAPEDRVGGYARQVTLARDYLKAMRIRAPAADALARLFAEGELDAVAHPTRATVAYPLGKRFEDAYADASGGGEPISAAANLVGLPSLALPSGFGPGNLPTSISFTGPAWQENRLLAIGRAYQARTDWHRCRPAI